MPAWLALRSRSLARGSAGFQTVLCCFLSQLLYGDFVCDVSLLLCLLFSRHTNPIQNAKSLSFCTVLYGSMSLCKFFVWRFGYCFCCFWFLFPLFLLFCLFGRVFSLICMVTVLRKSSWHFQIPPTLSYLWFLNRIIKS